MDNHQLERSTIITAVDFEVDVDREINPRQRRRVVQRASAFVGALGLAGLVLAGCGPDPNDVLGAHAPHGVAPAGGSSVNGLLDEWSVRDDAGTIHAGPVTFTFDNRGTMVHEMLVTRTDISPGRIPVDPATQKFDEEDPASTVLDEISEFEPGKAGSVTINLAPGNYQLVCNVPGHYANGMYTRITVIP